jgi:hypothetical protein
MSAEVKNFQRDLDGDREAKNRFVDAEEDSVSCSEDNSSDEEEEQIKIVAPRKKKKSAIDTMLLEQTLNQQKSYIKAQKTIYKLRSEVDTEEVKMRYLKLDLNNVQVKLDEALVKNKELFKVQIENLVLRVIIVFYILWRFLGLFTL